MSQKHSCSTKPEDLETTHEDPRDSKVERKHQDRPRIFRPPFPSSAAVYVEDERHG